MADGKMAAIWIVATPVPQPTSTAFDTLVMD